MEQRQSEHQSGQATHRATLPSLLSRGRRGSIEGLLLSSQRTFSTKSMNHNMIFMTRERLTRIFA